MYVSAECIQKDIMGMPNSSVVKEIKRYFEYIPHIEDCAPKEHYYSLEYDCRSEYFCLTFRTPPVIETELKLIIYPIIELKYGNIDRRIHLTTHNLQELGAMWEFIKMFRNQSY